MSANLEQLVRDTFADQWWYSPQMPIDEVLIRARARLRHDHEEKCSVVVENLRQLREDRGLTLYEARAILVADEALGVSYDARLSSGHVLGFEEREAWVKLVETSQTRVTAHARVALYGSWKLCAACEFDPDPRGPTACASCQALNNQGGGS